MWSETSKKKLCNSRFSDTIKMSKLNSTYAFLSSTKLKFIKGNHKNNNN